MKMDKKQILVGGIMGGVLIYIVPKIFIKGMPVWVNYILGTVAFLLIAGGIFYFILGDLLSNKKGKKSKKGTEIEEKLKAGLITPEEAITLQKNEMLAEIERVKSDIELEKQKYLLEQQKMELEKLKRGPVNEKKQESFKMPDVLGNISGLMQAPTQQNNSPEAKPKDNSEDLRNLF